MGTTNGVDTGLGQTEVAHLALLDKISHCASHLFHGDIGIDAVLIEEIDHIGVEPAQGGLGHGADILRPAVQPIGHLAVLETELGGDHHLVPERGQRLPQQQLVIAWAISLGGIEEGHPQFMGAADQGDGLPLVRGRAIAKAQPHAAQTDGRHFQPAVTQSTCLHDGSLFLEGALLGKRHGVGAWHPPGVMVGDSRLAPDAGAAGTATHMALRRMLASTSWV